MSNHQNHQNIEFEHYEGPNAPPVDRRKSQFQAPPESAARTYQCSQCTQSFDRPSSLETHRIVHTGARPHACRFCDKNYTTPSNVYRHERKCKKNPSLPEVIGAHPGGHPEGALPGPPPQTRVADGVIPGPTSIPYHVVQPPNSVPKQNLSEVHRAQRQQVFVADASAYDVPVGKSQPSDGRSDVAEPLGYLGPDHSLPSRDIDPAVGGVPRHAATLPPSSAGNSDALQRSSRFIYPSTSEVAHEALKMFQAFSDTSLADRESLHVSTASVVGVTGGALGALSELPLKISPIAPTGLFP